MNFIDLKQPANGLLIALVIAAATLALADEPASVAPAETHVIGAAEATGTENRAADTAALTPMTIEINAVLAEVRSRVAALQEQFAGETDATVAMDLVRRIERSKIDAESDILRIQLRHAQAAGRDELVRELETALTALDAPRSSVPSTIRPASDAGDR